MAAALHMDALTPAWCDRLLNCSILFVDNLFQHCSQNNTELERIQPGSAPRSVSSSPSFISRMVHNNRQIQRHS